MIGYRSIGSRLFDIFNITIMLIFSLLCILPFIHIIAGSFAPAEEILKEGFLLIPKKYSLAAYRYIFSTDTLIRSMLITVYVTVVGTFANILFTSLMAYPLSRSNLKGRNIIMFGVVFTMLFRGGMIPTFLVVKAMGLLNSLYSLIIPTVINAFNLVIMKNFFQQIPVELEEAAKMDGYNDLFIFGRIILPLSKSVLATLTLFYAVGHWNKYFEAIIYLNNSNLWPIQVLLRQIVILAQGGIGDLDQMDPDFVVPAKSVQMATVVVATVPILLVYPFLQKHFVKGVLIGSIKG
ncbi:putative aldouronate transport system permease protein [Caldicoprobacter guelmensis]|uniref:carbohydrate ABC transporter permease n=1 Tax=Caldicoprobacter guelmensis TaxID=1170224 RepID=UPI001956367F|nr:carbohydrate ABC transporter permease [Caldicoprobacter guelmensis]MBM7583413.1 putative aldouronate transport system permease protein [Caldicoprobacter guelmensis]